MAMALTDPNVTGAWKNISPLTARGSLLSAPTMLYVVELVTRTHQADEYEMKTDERPDRTMARMMLLRESAGKLRARFALDQSSTKMEAMRSTGIVRRLL
jgi:hypothetical protein